MSSAIYEGIVVHTRLRPRRHKLSYRVFSLLLDLDDLDRPSRCRLLGLNQPGILSFQERDHGDGPQGGLRGWVMDRLAAHGIRLALPRIEVLCYPRLFGYVFNPLTVYFCADGGQLRAIIYEVCNTFGERTSYVMKATWRDGVVEHSRDKGLYVSPFAPMEARYHFRIMPPGDEVQLHIDESDADGLFLKAGFAGRRVPLTDGTLLRLLLGYPLMTLKVIVAIHWEALKLWRKGVPVFRHTRAG